MEATKGPNGEPGVVIVHVEACDHLHRVLNKIRDLGGSPSVAMNPHTPAEMVKVIFSLMHSLTLYIHSLTHSLYICTHSLTLYILTHSIYIHSLTLYILTHSLYTS